MKEKSVSTGYLEAEEKMSVSERLAEGQPARGTFAIKKRTVSSSLQVSDFTQLLSLHAVVGNAQRQQSNDQDQEQDPPETQVLHKFLPRGPEAGQDSFALLEIGVEQ